MIKFEHTLFALPFAFLGAIMAANGFPTWQQILWITVAMVGARSAAMTFNRIVDREIDAQNPRTANRELPTGKLSVGFAWFFMYVAIGIFLLASYSLNWITFALSPVALFFVLGYSYAKRYTAFAHLLLGIALAISPSAAWIAVRGDLTEVPILTFYMRVRTRSLTAASDSTPYRPVSESNNRFGSPGCFIFKPSSCCSSST